jgi:aminoglycoside phosphotransferase (APT) family kinase protein
VRHQRRIVVGQVDKPEISEVRPDEALPWDRLVPYLRGALPELDGEFAVQQFPNGAANLTYLLCFGATRLVLRRPPFGQIAPGAHDMRREYKVLSRLWEFYPPAPRAWHLATDHSIVGSDFVVMEYRSGQVIWGELPESLQDVPKAATRVGQAVVRALAELHLLDPAECGVGDLGRPDGFVRRQVEGWAKRWELVAPAAPHDGAEYMSEVGAQLAAAMPRPQRVSILHNDYKVDNCQFRPGDPDQVNAVFDWDMATLGDPLVDVGTLLNYWPDPADTPDDSALVPPGLETLGLPSRQEVVAEYAATTGLDLEGIRWYEAFACYKTAVVLQQLYSRWARGETTDPRMEARGASVGPMARRAAKLLS